MAQNVIIAGATYSDVPSVELVKTDSTIASFVDTTDANAVAADIASGKTAYVNGTKITGTGSGGSSYPFITEANFIETYNYNGSTTQSLIYYDSASSGKETIRGSNNYTNNYYYYLTVPAVTSAHIGDSILSHTENIRVPMYKYYLAGPVIITSNTTGFQTPTLTTIRNCNPFIWKYNGASYTAGTYNDQEAVVIDWNGIILDVDTWSNIATKINSKTYSLNNGMAIVNNGMYYDISYSVTSPAILIN